MKNKLTCAELIQLADNLLHPKGKDLTSEELNQQLLIFCANCPDPLAAMDIIVETRPPITAAALVDRALACPQRDITDVPESELAATHPLRRMGN